MVDLAIPSLKPWHCAAILFICVFGAYLNSLDNGYVAFDDVAIYGSLSARPEKSMMTALKEQFRESPLDFARFSLGSRYPRELSLRLDGMIFGDDVWSRHFSNLLYQYAASLAALLAGIMLLGSRGAGLAAAVLFTLHPVQTESIAYLAGRRDILSGGLFLASFYFWTRYIDGKRPAHLASCLALWVPSLSAKQTAIVLPVAALGHLWLKGGTRLSLTRRWKVVLAAAALLAAAYAIINVWNQLVIIRLDRLLPQSYWYGGSIRTQMLTAPVVLGKALWLLLWPADLCADYSYLSVPPVVSLLDWRLALSLAAIAGAVAAGISLRRKRPLISFSILWIFLTYAPTLPLIPSTHNVEVFAEHWLYLPVFGFSLILGSLWKEAARKRPAVALICLSLVSAAYGARTMARNPDWRDGRALWSHVLERHPACVRALSNFALIQEHAGDPASAESLLLRASEIKPDEAPTWINLGYHHYRLGRFDRAREALDRALKVPGNKVFLREIWHSLGMVDLAEGRLPQAERSFKHALARQLKRKNVPSLDGLGYVSFLLGKYSRAEELLKKAVDQDPKYATALNNLGILYYETGRSEEAIPWLERALSVDPFFPDPHINLALAHSAMGEHGKAMRHALRAAQLAPGLHKSWLAKSLCLRRHKKFGRALVAAKEAARLRESPRSLLELGLAHRGLKQWPEALSSIERALELRPDDPELRFHHAGTLWESGRDLKAYAELYGLLSTHPDYQPAVDAMGYMRAELEKRGVRGLRPPPR